MTERQTRFVTEYIKDGNATQAAKRAGFSAKTARQAGARMLSDVAVCAAVEQARGPVLDHAKVTLAGHLTELATIRDLAKHAGQFGPAAKAEADRGKVAGFYVDRHAGPDGEALQLTVVRTIVRAK